MSGLLPKENRVSCKLSEKYLHICHFTQLPKAKVWFIMYIWGITRKRYKKK